MGAAPPAFWRTRAGLFAAAFLAPYSASILAGSLTLGRAVALLFGGLLAFDLYKERPRDFRVDTAAVLLIVAYLGLCTWILLNSATTGCNCDGKLGGFYEFALIGILAVVAIGFEPKLRGVAITATIGGVALACILALAGVGSLNSATVDLTETGGRLSGTYGNANELGFVAALVFPAVLAYRSVQGRQTRIAIGAALLVLAVTLVLTFSRGAIVAVGVGVLVLALRQGSRTRRQLALIVGAAAGCVLLAAASYSYFERERRDVSFESVSSGLRPLDQRDLSGWDGRARGPIPNGPSQLISSHGTIAVRSTQAGEGASFRWGEAGPGNTYTLRLDARARGPQVPFRYALGEAGRKASEQAARNLGQDWRRLSVSWTPRRHVARATLYLWQQKGASTFEFANVRVIVRGSEPEIISVPGDLEGSLYDRLASQAFDLEERYIQSRLDAADLAVQGLVANPLTGIGWATFPDYARANLDYGLLAAHTQYLSIAAELGILGVIFLALLIAAVVIGVRRAGHSLAEDAAIAMLATAAAGMVFVEALPVPQLSIPIGLAAAVVCAGRRTATR
jgi:O-Antigen ligase